MKNRRGWRGEPVRHGLSSRGIKTAVPKDQAIHKVVNNAKPIINKVYEKGYLTQVTNSAGNKKPVWIVQAIGSKWKAHYSKPPYRTVETTNKGSMEDFAIKMSEKGHSLVELKD